MTSLIVGLIFGAIFGLSVVLKGADVSKYRRQINRLKEQVNSLQHNLESKNKLTSNLQAQISDLWVTLKGKDEQIGVFPKPFCSLEPSKENPMISRFISELKIGRPKLEVSTVKRGDSDVIASVTVKHSAPCGSTWYIAKKLIGVDIKRETLHDAICRAHHSYPCTATMNIDPEAKEPILHIGGHIMQEEVERALERALKRIIHIRLTDSQG